jgi:hypothetical protein
MAVWGELSTVDQVDDKAAFAQARDALDEVAHEPVVNDCGERSVGLTELVRLHRLALAVVLGFCGLTKRAASAWRADALKSPAVNRAALRC